MEWILAEIVAPLIVNGEWIFAKVVVPILVIGVLVLIHEMGHFLLAKWCGVGVLKFSVGFGPAVFKMRRRETVYQLSWIPLGGYVRMVGDMPDMLTGEQPTDSSVREEEVEDSEQDDDESVPPEVAAVIEDKSRWFVEKNFWQRSAIVFAGPFFNFLLAYVLVFVAALMYGEERLSSDPRVGSVMPGSPAQLAGLQEGDLIQGIDGSEIGSWTALAETIHSGTGGEIQLTVLREEESKQIAVKPQKKELRSYTGETKSAYVVGIGPTVLYVREGLSHAFKFGALWTADKTLLTYWGLWGMVSGQVSAEDLAGPLFILDTAGKQAEKGFDNLLYFTALLSVSLAVLNLLPIPILDGGHLLFFLIEALTGPISVRKKELAQSMGMLLLIGLMVFAIHNDIKRDTSKMEAGIAWDKDKEKPDSAETQPAASKPVFEAAE